AVQGVIVAGVAMDGEDKTLGQEKIVSRVQAGANELAVAAQSRKVLVQDDPLAAICPDAVTAVIDERIAQNRAERRTQLVAQISAGQQRIAFGSERTVRFRQRTGTIGIKFVRIAEI